MSEVMIALLIIVLGASALASTIATNRRQSASHLRLSVASRLAAELSDWARQGGLQALGPDTATLFGPLGEDEAPDCFAAPCDAADAARFYLHHWQRRLLLEVRGARIVLCDEVAPIGESSPVWSCNAGSAGRKARVIKIGWPEGNDRNPFPPRLILAIA